MNDDDAELADMPPEGSPEVDITLLSHEERERYFAGLYPPKDWWRPGRIHRHSRNLPGSGGGSLGARITIAEYEAALRLLRDAYFNSDGTVRFNPIAYTITNVMGGSDDV